MQHRIAAAAFLFLLALVAPAAQPANAAAPVPPTARKLVDRGDELEGRGDHKGAIAAYDEAIADDPSYAYAYASRCQSEWALDENATAAKDCNHAIALDPSSAYAYRQLGMALADMSETTKALDALNKSIQLDPSRAFSFAVRCQIKIDLKRYDDAFEDCNRAVAMDPKSLWGHLQRGRGELENADYAAAEADLTWVIDNHAETETAWYNRALTRLHTSNLKGALYDIGQYIGAEPKDGDGYYVKARIELALNDKGAANDAADEAWRRYYAAGDMANVRKTKQFIADNNLTSSPLSGIFAGILGVFVIVIGLVLTAVFTGLLVWALWRVLDRAGLQGPLALIALFPLGFVACLAILAFSPWNVKRRDEI